MAVVAACLASACGGGPPLAPSPVPTPITRPLVLSGQSNAVNLAPFLSAIYPLPVLTVAENGQPIRSWAGSNVGHLWLQLVPMLRDPIQAFVWWQGESDRNNPQYLSDLRELMGRVRQENGNPQLYVIVVRVFDLPPNAAVRIAQETFVQTDPNAVLISSDGFQMDDGDHLTDAGYQAVAERVVAAVEGRIRR